MWYTYVLYSITFDKFYIGVTRDLEVRLEEHRKKRTYTTARFGVWELAYYEVSFSEKDARIRERQLKTGFGRGYLRRRMQNYLRQKSQNGRSVGA